MLALNWTNVGAILAGMAAGAVLAAPAITFLRRPSLGLAADIPRRWTRVEGDGAPWVRLVVRCSSLTRGARGTRVMFESFRPKGARRDDVFETTLGGTPSLGWPSAQDESGGSLTVHPGATRPVNLGRFVRSQSRHEIFFATWGEGGIHGLPEPDAWHLHLGLAGDFALTDGRDVIPPGDWTLHLLVVADDAKTRRYDVDLDWDGEAVDGAALLRSLTITVRSA